MNKKPTRPRPSQWFWCQECGRRGSYHLMEMLGIRKEIEKWYGAEFARYWKQPRGGAKIWLLERGIKFVLREPL